MHEIEKCERCSHCMGTHLCPKGWNRKCTKRRHKCGDCKKHLTSDENAWFVSDSPKDLIDKLLKERISL